MATGSGPGSPFPDGRVHGTRRPPPGGCRRLPHGHAVTRDLPIYHGAMSNCPTCAAPLPGDARFCPTCGGPAAPGPGVRGRVDSAVELRIATAAKLTIQYRSHA